MLRYAFWNNKGGVGKTYLCFIAASEYAHRHKNSDVYVIDMCPQANVSEIFLGGYQKSSEAINELIHSTPRRTVAGYIESRLNSPFSMIKDIGPFVVEPHKWNPHIPKNLKLIAGDYLLEILAEAIRQTSQLAVPLNAWAKVMSWISDLEFALRDLSGERDVLIMIDCNPSFAVYTQLALASTDNIVIPFTADDSSRRALENVVALLYGIGDPHTAAYAKLSFENKAKEFSLKIPKLHAFVSNRVTQHGGKASKAFQAISKTIQATMDNLHVQHRSIFSMPKDKPSTNFIEVPDYHGACIVSSVLGIPLHKLTPGPKKVIGERVQINKDPLDRYKEALTKFIDLL